MPDTLSVDLILSDDKLDATLRNDKQKLESWARNIEGIKPQIAKSIEKDFASMEKRAEDARKKLTQIAGVRLDNGQVNTLTREIVKASERAKTLSSDISNIKKELANPNRKTSISFLIDELRGAEKELDSLNRKFSTLSSGRGGGSPAGSAGGTRNLGLSSFQKTNLSYQANDVISGLASGQNPTQILAQQGGQIAQIFSPAQAGALVAAYAPLVGILSAGAVAIGLTYKITKDLREEAERYLKTQEGLAVAQNKQILGSQELIRNLQEQRRIAKEAREFGDFLQGGSVEELTRRKDLLQKLYDLNAKGIVEGDKSKRGEEARANLERQAQQIISLEQQISDVQKRQQTNIANSYNQRIENEKRFREAEIQANARYAQEQFSRILSTSKDDAVKLRQTLQAVFNDKNITADAKNSLIGQFTDAINKTVESGKSKVLELGKTFQTVADGVFARSGSNNPFVQLFSEADRNLQNLRENTRGLSKDLVQTFEQMEQKTNSLKLFELRLNGTLSAFDLRSQADNFRNATAPRTAEETKSKQDEIINDFIKRNPNYLFLRGVNQVDESARLDILNSSFLGRETLKTTNPLEAIQERLNKQISLIYSERLNADELGIADKKLIGLTNGVNPLELTRQQRDTAALAREREAVRIEQSEKFAQSQRAESLTVQKRIADEMTALRKIAESEGLTGVIRIVNDAEDSARVSLGKRPTLKDTAKLFDF